MSNINKTRIITKVVKGKTIPVCIKFLCFKCEEDIENEFKTYKNEKTNYYVCEDCVPVAELLKKKKAEDKWANLAKKVIEVVRIQKKEDEEDERELKKFWGRMRERQQVKIFENFLIDLCSRYTKMDIRKKFEIEDMLNSFGMYSNEQLGKRLFDWSREKYNSNITFACVQEAVIVGGKLMNDWWNEIEWTQEVFDWIEGTKKIYL
jgi:glycerol-3-phosphate cytidylyltransferase-like family protein